RPTLLAVAPHAPNLPREPHETRIFFDVAASVLAAGFRADRRLTRFRPDGSGRTARRRRGQGRTETDHRNERVRRPHPGGEPGGPGGARDRLSRPAAVHRRRGGEKGAAHVRAGARPVRGRRAGETGRGGAGTGAVAERYHHAWPRRTIAEIARGQPFGL